MGSSFSNEQIEHLPQHQTVQLQPLPGAALGYRLTRALLWLVGLLVATAAVAYLRPLDFAALRPWLPYVLPAYACLHILWQYLTYRHSGYAIRGHDVMYQRGVIWRTTTLLPFARIQHSEIHHGPLERLWSVSTLQLFSAGGFAADLTMSGLHHQQNQALRDVIQQYHNDEQ